MMQITGKLAIVLVVTVMSSLTPLAFAEGEIVKTHPAIEDAAWTPIQLGIFSAKANGIELKFPFNVDHVRGVGFGYAVHARSAIGIQSGWINDCDWFMRGMQIGGGNFAPVHGIQVGLFNIAETSSACLQFGALNIGDGTLYGAQLGVINYANSLSGIQIGVVNIIKESEHPFVPLINWSF